MTGNIQRILQGKEGLSDDSFVSFLEVEAHEMVLR